MYIVVTFGYPYQFLDVASTLEYKRMNNMAA